MSSNIYSVGLNHVGAFQVSGRPFFETQTLPATADDSIRFEFPNVTKRVAIKTNCNHGIRVHFVPWNTNEFGFTEGASTNNNYFYLDDSGPLELEVKCKEIFISPIQNEGSDTVTIFAELTNIPASRMYSLEGLEGVSR
jgi:hypothetical protein